MDSNLLVAAGHKLLSELEAKGFKARAAMWVHNTDVDTWKLMIVPPKNFSDQRAFYRMVAEAVSANKDIFKGIDASYAQMVKDSHPAMKSLSKLFRVTGNSSAFLQNNRLDDFYLADGIIILMDL